MRNERLIKLRNSIELTQDGLSKKVGLTQSMIAHIEAGRKEPSKKYKMALAKYFNVSVEWLFYEQINDNKSYKKASSA